MATIRRFIPAGLMARIPHKRWQVRLPSPDTRLLPDMDMPWMRFWSRSKAEARLRRLNLDDSRRPLYVLVDLLTGETPEIDPAGPVARPEGKWMRRLLYPVNIAVLAYNLWALSGATLTSQRVLLGVLLVTQSFMLGVVGTRRLAKAGAP